MFPKFLSAEQVKAAEDKAKADKKKRKELKKKVFELSQNPIVAKLREDLELSNSRAEHFEREYFNLKRSLIFQADQELRSELYEMERQLKQKDAEIKIYCDQTVELLQQNETLRSQIMGTSGEKKLPKVDICELTTDEVNDQVNELNTQK